MVEGWSIENKFDMDRYNGQPKRRIQEIHLHHWLNNRENSAIRANVHLRKVTYSTYDSFIQLGQKTFTGAFYQVHKIVEQLQSKVLDPNLVLETNIYLSPYQVKYLRMVYGVTNLLSDLGGVMAIMVSFFGIIFHPISKFMYYMNAIKRLFLARTREQKLFIEPKKGMYSSKAEGEMMYYLDERNFPKHLDDRTRKEIGKHRLIRLSNGDKFLLFIMHNFPFFSRCIKWDKKDKLLRMYRDGIDRIEKDLNLVRLVKNLKRIHILMKNSLMTSKIDFEIAHQPENCIDVDCIDQRLSDESHSSFDDTGSCESYFGGIKRCSKPNQPFLR